MNEIVVPQNASGLGIDGTEALPAFLKRDAAKKEQAKAKTQEGVSSTESAPTKH